MAAHRLDMVDPAAFFGLLGAAPVSCVEDNPVAGFEGALCRRFGRRFDPNPVRQYPFYPSHQHPAVPRGAAGDHLLMVDAADEIRAQPARVDLF